MISPTDAKAALSFRKEIAQLEQELNEVNKTMATYGGIEDLLCPEFEGVDDLVECFRLLKEERDTLKRERDESRELLNKQREACKA